MKKLMINKDSSSTSANSPIVMAKIAINIRNTVAPSDNNIKLARSIVERCIIQLTRNDEMKKNNKI